MIFSLTGNLRCLLFQEGSWNLKLEHYLKMQLLRGSIRMLRIDLILTFAGRAYIRVGISYAPESSRRYSFVSLQAAT